MGCPPRSACRHHEAASGGLEGCCGGRCFNTRAQRATQRNTCARAVQQQRSEDVGGGRREREEANITIFNVG